MISDQVFNLALIALLFVFGFSFAADKNAVEKMRKTGLKIVVFPLLVALGSLIAGLVAGLLLQISLGGAMAVSSGYGWYTLSGPMMGQLMGPKWGTLGFTSNFFRELITITTIPIMVKLDRLAPVASGRRNNNGYDPWSYNPLLWERHADFGFLLSRIINTVDCCALRYGGVSFVGLT